MKEIITEYRDISRKDSKGVWVNEVRTITNNVVVSVERIPMTMEEYNKQVKESKLQAREVGELLGGCVAVILKYVLIIGVIISIIVIGIRIGIG